MVEGMDFPKKIEYIRAEMPITQSLAFLNTGTNGPLSRSSYETLVAYAQDELNQGRIGEASFKRMLQNQVETREELSTILGCNPRDIALTHNTTEGINMALMGLNWKEDDEVITSVLEHPGVLHPLYLLHRRYGVKIRFTQIGHKDHDVMTELKEALNAKTRAVVLSHVSWSTGMVLPLREIAEETHKYHALLICDAAQACGMVPTNMAELGVDAYACSGQKWLAGPDGTGALFIKEDQLDFFHQTFIGYWGIQTSTIDSEGNYVPTSEAFRFEVGALSPPIIAAFKTNLRWLREEIGWEWIYQRIQSLGQFCYAHISQLPGVTMHTPSESMAGLVHFSLDGSSAQELSSLLAQQGFLIRNTPNPAALRVSTGFYNTEDEIVRLVATLQDTLSQA